MALNNSNIFYPVISIVVPFSGEKTELFTCLNMIRVQNINLPFEIIVVESGLDSEVKLFVGSIENAHLISSAFQLYPGEARNVGVKSSKSDLLAFIDADCVPSNNWLCEVYSSLINGNEIVVGPIINLFPFHPIASVDNLLQFVDFPKYRSLKKLSHFPACNLGITKQLFIKAGGFPEIYPAGEDILFSESALKYCNCNINFNRNQIVRHSGRNNISGLIKHNENFGFYRGLLRLKVSDNNTKLKRCFLFSLLFGFKRLVYIFFRTLQWNPAGIIRLIFFSPFVLIGLAAWVKGFWKGNRECFNKINSKQFSSGYFCNKWL